MKQLLFISLIILFIQSVYSQKQPPILKGEKVAITCLHFHSNGGFFDKNSLKVDTSLALDNSNNTLYLLLTKLEETLAKKFDTKIEPTKFDSLTAKAFSSFTKYDCYPKLRTKEAIKLEYDKIIEVRLTLGPGPSIGPSIAPGVSVSVTKPRMNIEIMVKDKKGKKVYRSTHKAIADTSRESVTATVVGIGLVDGMKGKEIIDIYDKLMKEILSDK